MEKIKCKDEIEVFQLSFFHTIHERFPGEIACFQPSWFVKVCPIVDKFTPSVSSFSCQSPLFGHYLQMALSSY